MLIVSGKHHSRCSYFIPPPVMNSLLIISYLCSNIRHNRLKCIGIEGLYNFTPRIVKSGCVEPVS